MDRSSLSPGDLSDCLVVKSLISQLHVRCSNHTVAAEFVRHQHWHDGAETIHDDIMSEKAEEGQEGGDLEQHHLQSTQLKRRKLVVESQSTESNPPPSHDYKNTSNNSKEELSHSDSLLEAGCTWTGPFDQLEGHRKLCDFEVALCKHGCQTKLARKVLQVHQLVCTWAVIECPHCRQEVMMRNLKDHSANVCPMRLVSCTSGAPCKWTGAQQELQRHLADSCCAIEVLCSVCDQRFLRSQMAEHLQVSMIDHFTRVIGRVATLKQEVQLLRDKTDVLEVGPDVSPACCIHSRFVRECF
jgi:hypothetical protein